MPSEDDSHYEMTISLHVLEHLGIGLYSNVPAVLSEVVANSWDADASTVTVSVDAEGSEVVIEDDGYGMDEDDINNKYLRVGYQKRKAEGQTTPSGRPVQGKKGIGKLSVFSVAKIVKVYSAKVYGDEHERAGERVENAFRMNRDDIKAEVQDGNSDDDGGNDDGGNENSDQRKSGTYQPTEISTDPIDFQTGTRIVLEELDKRLDTTAKYLKQRLARRFSLIGRENGFEVFVQREDSDSDDSSPVSPKDRGYYHKLQFVWYFGEDSQDIVDRCPNLEVAKEINPLVYKERTEDGVLDRKLSGWIGTVEVPSDLKEVDNSIVVFARGKLVQEDVLGRFGEARVFADYVMGEVDAEFLDLPKEEDDIITSDRQSIKEDEPRYDALMKHIRGTLNQMKREWTSLRNELGVENALQNPILREWYETLSSGNRGAAEKMFGRIESLKLPDDESKRQLYRNSLLAFEKLALRDKLDALQHVRTEHDFEIVHDLFSGVDELEASHYYEIAKGRLEVIDKFADIAEDSRERVLQQYLFDHLWLLDPSWERATTDERMEESIKTAFDDVSDGLLSAQERRGRVDIRYKRMAGSHVIVELKKYNRKVDVNDLTKQVRKYRSALEKLLRENYQIHNPNIECICVLGEQPEPKDDPTYVRDILARTGARYVTYEQLIQNAQRSYQDYLNAASKVSRVAELIDALLEPTTGEVESAEVQAEEDSPILGDGGEHSGDGVPAAQSE